MDGQTRQGEAFGLKPNQPVRHGREARRGFSRKGNIVIYHQRNYGRGGDVGGFCGVGATPGVGAVFFLERSFCNSSVILCLTIF
jgi:hypothetical protein